MLTFTVVGKKPAPSVLLGVLFTFLFCTNLGLHLSNNRANANIGPSLFNHSILKTVRVSKALLKLSRKIVCIRYYELSTSMAIIRNILV